MSERPDDLDARLRDLAAGGPSALPGAAAARQRGDQRTRRHRAVLAGAGAAVVAAVAVTVGVTDVGGVDRIRPTQVGEAPAPSPTGPSATPTPSVPPSPPSTSSPYATPGATAGAQGGPVQDLLLDEVAVERVEPDDWTGDEPSDWTRGEPVSPPLLDPCAGGTAYPRDTDRTSTAATSWQTLREAGGTTVQQTVARYTSPAVAADAASGYARAVRGCPGGSEAPDSFATAYEVVRSDQEAGASTVVVRVSQGAIYASYVAVQQQGDLVSVLSVGYGEDGDPGVQAIEPYLPAVTAALRRE